MGLLLGRVEIVLVSLIRVFEKVFKVVVDGDLLLALDRGEGRLGFSIKGKEINVGLQVWVEKLQYDVHCRTEI
jgi:hypothetical protein